MESKSKMSKSFLSRVASKSVVEQPSTTEQRRSKETIQAVSVEHAKRKKKGRHHHGKHHHHKSKKIESLAPNFDMVPDVAHVVLSEEVQRLLKCLVGEDVTAEKPWTYVNKFYISEQVESDDIPVEYESFIAYKQQIAEFPNDTMLIGYIPDEGREYDEFYFCCTLNAEEEVLKLVKEQEAEQQARLENTINKRVGLWTTLGSAAEVEEAWLTNTRGLYQIEFEAKYPIIRADVKFRFRLVADVRDGYSELLVPSKHMVASIYKRRIENTVQVAPTKLKHEAQTHCGYPRNAWTQYEYHVDYIENLSKEWVARFRVFVDRYMNEFTDFLYFNGGINLYTNDYVDLCTTPLPMTMDTVYSEYNSFFDVKRCMNKMISAMSWHPMWTGIIAIAYADLSPKWYNTDQKDDVLMHNIVHGYNPILIWSFDDSLYPKLILETNAEVHCLAFCPHDPNLLVGGCLNGQVVLWDIKNKLTKVETEEVLTPAQQSYRARMANEMRWMTNTRDYSLVPPTAFSNLMFSHVNNVTAIELIHPAYKLSRAGRLERVNEEDESVLQFVTSSSDGTLKFWDLKPKLTSTGEYKGVRKSRRLGKRPSALTVDVSPYRLLNRILAPHFQIDILLPGTEKLCPVSSLCLSFDKLKYEEKEPDPTRIPGFTERLIYQPTTDYPNKQAIPVVGLGTYIGSFVLATWDGYEYTTGDTYAKEDAKFFNFAKYHDGPMLTCKRHPVLQDVYLSVGGKIFCIWVDKLKDKPMFWRRSRNRYTHGNWEKGRACCFWLTTSNGSCEFWNLDITSDGPYSDVTYSGKPLLESELHPLPLMNGEQKVFGIADDRGTLRLFSYKSNVDEDTEELSSFRKFVNNNAERAMEFIEWQTKWTRMHASWIREQAAKELAEQARLWEKKVARQAAEEERLAKEALEEARAKAAQLHPPPGMFEEWAQEQWILKEQERMGNELLTNKRLDKDTLIRQQAPLKKLEAEAARKQQKIKQRLAKVDEIFNDTIAMLFPSLVEKPPVPDRFDTLYTSEEKEKMQTNFMLAYYDIEEQSAAFVEENPYIYELNWKTTMLEKKKKKMLEQLKYMDKHSDRYKQDKMQERISTSTVVYQNISKDWNEEEESENTDNEVDNDTV